MTLQFTAPTIGSKVRVTSRFKNNYAHATSEFVDYTVEGVVVPNHKLTRLNTFAMRVSCPNVPNREFALANVTDLQYLDGTVAAKGKVSTEIKTLEVKGSKGATYIVIKKGINVTCTCVSFQYRRTCKHLELIK